MEDKTPTPNFWIGNAVLGLALLMLLFMGSLWEAMGVAAMVLWAIVVGIGVYFMMKDKDGPPTLPQ